MIRSFWVALFSTALLAGTALEASAQRGGRGGYYGGGRGYGGYNGGYYHGGYGGNYYGSGWGVTISPGGVGVGYNNGYYGNRYYGNGFYNNSYYTNGGYYTNGYYTPSYSSTPTYTYSAPVSGVVTTSAYTPAPALSPSRAYLSIQVPDDDAQVWINGVATTRMGLERTFESPDLEQGPLYSYTVRAKWTVNGKNMDETRKVSVQPGRQSSVDFRTSASDTIPAPERK